MLDAAIIATVSAVIFVGELPDKTAIASLVLGTRYPWRWAFTGVAAAFLTHVLIAVAAGSLISLLPRRPVEAVVAGLFLLGAVLVWREGLEDEEQIEEAEEQQIARVPAATSFWRVAAVAYSIIFIAEWGDITQILTANFAAKYDNPISVGVGGTGGLWAVGLLAILGGKTLLRVLPMRWITRVAAVAMVILALASIVKAVRG